MSEPAGEVDLVGAERVTYRVSQRFRYTYDGAATDLDHRLVAVPPVRHGGQLRRYMDLRVSAPHARTTWQRGPDGLQVANIRIDVVPPTLDFDITVVVERVADLGWPELPASALSSRRLLAPTPLTTPTAAMVDAARSLASSDPVATARRVCGWVYQRIEYVSGSTDVGTTAAQALAGGSGVCQDQAHIMIAMCRAVGIPARYVSGHLVGEGASHAWVEVVVPSGALSSGGALPLSGALASSGALPSGRAVPRGGVLSPGGAGAVAVPFDPCHDRTADLRYVTVGVGRDYQDVAPTSGRYVGVGRGALVATQRVDVVSVVPPAAAPAACAAPVVAATVTE
ncbi:transglutaminase [Frankia sp. CcI49]|uniref:transglutaminase family protein n=1 Tax=unclassified Frankia TaxID=2632575 RepID=UPI0006CA2CDD|nr:MULTISPECIES: transglutaminase family protein [unclassified Frankia]KPM57249.1 transglutaminase [Frankia sp. R43]ONH50821.1 transglutaminase [Frankia sp. CcI49]